MRVKALSQHGAQLVHKGPRCGAAWKGMGERRPTAIDPGDDDRSARVLSDGRGREHFRGGSILIPAWRLSTHPVSLGCERTRNKDDPDCGCGQQRRWSREDRKGPRANLCQKLFAKPQLRVAYLPPSAQAVMQ